MVSEVTIGTAIDAQSKTAASTTQLAEDFSQFLTLLTVQLQNQDPFDPMDTTEFTNQIVAFTGVEQQINSNQKLDDLIALQLSSSMGSALGYVGLNVSYISNEAHFDGEKPVNITYALAGDAVDTKIRIYDEEGKEVFSDDVSSATGSNKFVWDGKDKNGNVVPEGTYEIKIDALDINNEGVKSTVVVEGRVRGVETQNGLLFALVGDRAVAFSNILNANEPEETQTAGADDEGTGNTPEDSET